MIDQLNNNIENSQPCYIHRAIEPTFDWNIVANHLTYCADNDYGEPVGVLNYKLVGADTLDPIKVVKEYLNEELSKEVLGADMVVTFKTTSDSVVFGGKNDVLIWNVLGVSTFQIKDGEERQLIPGDVVYVPKETEYIVKPESARVFVIFSLEQ